MGADTKTGIIYCWRNVRTEKRYIGQTVNPKRRFNRHKHHLGNYDGQNHFYRAMNKYSELSDWEYTVIEEVPKELLDQREIYWIAFYNSNDPKHGYNMATGGNRHDGFELSAESRRKISEAKKGRKFSAETCKKISESQRGRKFSAESCRKMSAAKKGNSWNKGKKCSAETRRKISESLKGKPSGNKCSEETRRKISNARNPNRIAIYQNDTLITICDTLKEAACLTDVSHACVQRIASGKGSKTKSGYSFKYILKSA